MRFVNRMDAMKSILLTLARKEETAGGIMYGENLTEEMTGEFLGTLRRGGLVTLDEIGLYSITQKGRALLTNWEEIDTSILSGPRRPART